MSVLTLIRTKLVQPFFGLMSKRSDSWSDFDMLSPTFREKCSESERECLTVIWAVPIIRPHLEGAHFTVFTEHSPLKSMMNLTDVDRNLLQWRLRLIEFDFRVKYRNGAEHHVADAISTGTNLDRLISTSYVS